MFKRIVGETQFESWLSETEEPTLRQAYWAGYKEAEQDSRLKRALTYHPDGGKIIRKKPNYAKYTTGYDKTKRRLPKTIVDLIFQEEVKQLKAQGYEQNGKNA